MHDICQYPLQAVHASNMQPAPPTRQYFSTFTCWPCVRCTSAHVRPQNARATAYSAAGVCGAGCSAPKKRHATKKPVRATKPLASCPACTPTACTAAVQGAPLLLPPAVALTVALLLVLTVVLLVAVLVVVALLWVVAVLQLTSCSARAAQASSSKPPSTVTFDTFGPEPKRCAP